MIISKDLFIFGEQIFATIIPESALPPTPSAPQPLQQQQVFVLQDQQQQHAAIGASAREPQGGPFETTSSASATATTTISKSSLPSPPSSTSAIKKPTTTTATTKSSADKQEIKVAAAAAAAAASVLSGPTSAASPTCFNTSVGQLVGGLNLNTHTQAGASALTDATPRRKEKTLTRRSREATIKVAATTATKSGETSGSVPPQCATVSVECCAAGELEEGEVEAIKLTTDDKRCGEKEPLVQQRSRAKIIGIPAAGAGRVDESRINSLTHQTQHQLPQHQRQHQRADTPVSNSSYHNAFEEATTTAAAAVTTTGDKEHPTDFILNMGKVNLGNNNNATRTDHAMVTIPFIAESSNHTHLQLSFQNINVLHNDRKILADVSGLVSPGEVLAVMGPSGSGKTTLLDCLSGQRRIDSGSIYLNREPVSKKWRRKICYVLQEEIFFAGLTLRETVTYTALLRLPEKMPKAEKLKQVDRLLEELELGFCQQTKFGDYLNRGLSGGEKKRANIACELLTNPLLMLLDEPTSGLDSHSAISLMKILKRYAIQEQKTVVITVHQPSSQMFHMFDKLLLLYNGRTAYFGEVNNIYKYFEDIGVTIKPHYNPADFVLEQLKSYPDIREKLFLAAKESHHNFLNRNCLAVNGNNSPKVKSEAAATNGPTAAKAHPPHDALINDIIKNYYKEIENSSNTHLGHDTMLMIANRHNHHHHNEACEDPAQQLWCGADSQSTFSSASSEYHQQHCDGASDWFDYPTRFHTQFRVLSSRNFKEAKPRMLSKLNWFQTVGLALMAGAIWFQIPRTEEFLHDLQGWMFFSQTYWMLFALFGALNSFPSEREVISKERRSGAYRLSAYYLAKMFGELPLVVTLPTVYLMISYPMLGCTSFKLFSLMLVFLLLNTIVAQSVGFFIGACCMDMNVSITLSALYTLATQLFGGYLSSRIPEGLSWIRYTSMIHYAYQNMQILEFREGAPIRCGDPSSYEVCKSSSNPEAAYIPYEEILRAQNSTSPLWLNTCILMMFFVVFRSLGYAVLRYIRCPKT